MEKNPVIKLIETMKVTNIQQIVKLKNNSSFTGIPITSANKKSNQKQQKTKDMKTATSPKAINVRNKTCTVVLRGVAQKAQLVSIVLKRAKRSILLLTTILAIMHGEVYGQTASATYSGGNIGTDFNTNFTGTASCYGTLVVNIPAGAIITGVDVQYSMTGANNGFTSDQRSQLRCTSTGGTAETSVTFGYGGASSQTVN